MKKLMIMCFAVVAAAVAQAASINWSITNTYMPGSADKVAAGKYTAYLFVTANTTDVSLTTTTKSAVEAVLASGDLTGLSSLAAVSKANTALGAWTGATGLTGFSSGSLDAFAVIIDSTDAASAEHYLIVNDGATKNATFTSATGSKILGFGDQTALSKGSGWTSTAVPEPTSGLLLLLGMAGLALRRKQA